METIQNTTSTVPQNQTVENTDMNLLKQKRFILAGNFIGLVIRLGKYMLIFLAFLIGIIGFGAFLIAGLGAGMAHGRFLFFGLNRKPRKANIKNGASWQIKN